MDERKELAGFCADLEDSWESLPFVTDRPTVDEYGFQRKIFRCIYMK